MSGRETPGFDFCKVEGLGNDFVLLRGEPAARFAPELAPLLCDRRRGIGADGVLLLLPPRSEGADATMVLYNADGSEAEMCGNGLRCIAHALEPEPKPEPASPKRTLRIDTGAGVRECVLHARGDEAEVRADMGPVRWQEDLSLQLQGISLQLQRYCAGNPHLVTFDRLSDLQQQSLGPALERHPRFPQRINVSFAQVQDECTLQVIVWERGAGFTAACGTAACASAQAAWRQGLLCGERARVLLPGGTLLIERGAGERVWMTGPARRVFSGRWPLG